MKTRIKPLFAALLAGCSLLVNPVLASGKIPPYVHFTKNTIAAGEAHFSVDMRQLLNSQTVRLVIDKPIGKILTVILKDPQGYPLYRLVTSKKNSRENFDYNFLDADLGVYSIEVSDGKDKVTKQIKLQQVKAETVTKLIVD